MSGLSKQKQKYIQSLHNKKYRQQFGVFLVEGQKSIEEIKDSDFEVKEAFLSPSAAASANEFSNITICSDAELSKLSSFRSNNYGVLVVAQKENQILSVKENEWILALDDINDPGNLGTIIRIADWYGIAKIICSENTVECYNPKVISSSMGSFTRVSCFYTDLESYLSETELPVYGAYLNGENVHKKSFTSSGILLIGSESHGISEKIEPMVSHKITIPAFGKAESLNAGVATAVILDNIRR